MSDIFISYAREDRETARMLARALEGHGWSVWWDTRLKAGEIWDEMIERELMAARSVVVLWSAESVNSRWVRKEARYGDMKRMLFPALIETVEIPFEFSDVHAEDLRGWTGEPAHLGLRDLVDALAILLGKPARLQPKRAVPAKRPSAPEDPPDFSVFRDVDEPWYPEMVVLPAGEFMMGSSDSDIDAQNREKPRHKVIIGYRFAVGRYPVTFDEYDRFCEAAGREKSEDKGRGRGRRPVINVSWNDAKAYVDWLGKQTAKSYRLLTEAEWEYACRAGTTTRYSCGDTITEKDANVAEKNVFRALIGSSAGKTREVGSYPANAWGLYDLHGNVWEWAEDVWHENYKGAPDEGGAWTTGGDRNRRVLRGGSWNSVPKDLRSANRCMNFPGSREDDLGFRVARTL